MKLRNKAITGLLAIGLISTTLTNSYANEQNDIYGHWAESQIENFISLGYIDGYGNGIFKPNNSMKRGEFVKILNRVFGLTKSSGKVFEDTKNHWAKNEIDIAVTNGICKGKSESQFKPDDTITREEASVMIANYKKIADKKHDKLSTYSDSNEVSSWATDSVESVIEHGYMGGYNDNTFKPKKEISRAEAVATLSRIINNTQISTNKGQEIYNILKSNGWSVVDSSKLKKDAVTFENVTDKQNKYIVITIEWDNSIEWQSTEIIEKSKPIAEEVFKEIFRLPLANEIYYNLILLSESGAIESFQKKLYDRIEVGIDDYNYEEDKYSIYVVLPKLDDFEFIE